MTIDELIKLDISLTAKIVYIVLSTNRIQTLTTKDISEILGKHRVTSWRCKKELVKAGLLEQVPNTKGVMRLICL